jgi:segregation and condensation protein A
MSYRVRIESFEGPFDLLLYLVSRQKVSIGSISLSEITDQYLSEVQRMRNVDLDVASDFLLVASTLLEIKAASLIPHEESEKLDEEFDEISPDEMRDALVDHLLEYKKFKNAATALQARFEAEERMHARPFGPDRSFLTLVPDYLAGVKIEKLGQLCAACIARRDVFLLESEHIAVRVIPVETQVRLVYDRVCEKKQVHFSDFVTNQDDPHLIVVTFLAILELFKRNMVSLSQDELFGDIAICVEEGANRQILEGDTEFDSVIEDA